MLSLETIARPVGDVAPAYDQQRGSVPYPPKHIAVVCFKISYPTLLPRDATQPAQVAPTSRGRRKDPELVAP